MNILASSPDSMPALRMGTHYRLVQKIGQGGMSVVYEAFDERLKRLVALKILHPFLAQAPEYKARFLREAEAVARLTHPNIVQIYDVSHDEQLYIVTELLNGGTLKELAKHIDFVELPELGAMIICQMSKALAHAHSRNIIHRDIKPENIMITCEGHLKLMDFGIASIGNDESLTQAGTLLGSLAHIAPEVVRNEPATPQSDIYSLCTVFFWLLSGQLPFRGDSPHALLKAIVDTKPQKIQQLSPYISDSLAQIIEIGMHKDPKERFKSARELGLSIEQKLVELGVNFDLDKLTMVLHQPREELQNFKQTLLKNIKNQADIYTTNGQHAQALALQCRLDATQKTPITKSAKKNLVKIYCGAVLALSLACLGFFLLTQEAMPSFPKQQTIINSPLLIKDYESVFETPTPLSSEALIPKPINTEEKKPNPEIAPKLVLQELSVTIWPFASITLDGALVAQDVKHKILKLEPGLHRLKFTHTYAATVEKVVQIKRGKEPLTLTILMNKTKPAFLMVRATPEANIAVDGLFKGSSSKSMERPIVIRMPDKAHALLTEVIIQRDGFKPVIMPIKFIAGQTQEVNVSLVPLTLQRE